MKDLAQTPSSRGIEKLDTLICVEYTRGDYRIIYAVDDKQQLVTVLRLGYRRETYRSL